jgi:histidine triad (HIT) family protein
MTTASCVFCDIAQGRAPASIVYTDEQICAFMDIQPVNPGHLLVIPKEHATYLADLDPHTGGQMFQLGRDLAGALRASGIQCEGVNLFLADGQAAGQEVFHVHLHIIPRFRGDGFGFRFGPGYGLVPEREALDRKAIAIRRALENRG